MIKTESKIYVKSITLKRLLILIPKIKEQFNCNSVKNIECGYVLNRSLDILNQFFTDFVFVEEFVDFEKQIMFGMNTFSVVNWMYGDIIKDEENIIQSNIILLSFQYKPTLIDFNLFELFIKYMFEYLDLNDLGYINEWNNNFNF